MASATKILKPQGKPYLPCRKQDCQQRASWKILCDQLLSPSGLTCCKFQNSCDVRTGLMQHTCLENRPPPNLSHPLPIAALLQALVNTQSTTRIKSRIEAKAFCLIFTTSKVKLPKLHSWLPWTRQLSSSIH